MWARMRSWWRNLTRRQEVERELTEEVRAYVDLLAAEKMAGGLSAERARRAALLELGGEDLVKEGVRDVRSGAQLEQLVKDAGYALRTLRRSPGFAAASIAALALGIGVTTSIFSLVYGVLLRPLPYPQSHELQRVWMSNPQQGIEKDIVSYPQFLAWREQGRSFEQMVAVRALTLNLTGAGEPEELLGEAVTEGYFEMYGVAPQLGTGFTREQQAPDGPSAVILSHALWSTRFGGDRSVVGRTIQLSGTSYPVIGVMPPGFGEAQFWIPLSFRGIEELREAWGALWLPVYGRLRDGVSQAAAQSEMTRVAADLSRSNEAVEGQGVLLESLQESMIGESRTSLLLLLSAVVLVLLIACANIANLLLARSTTRQAEFSVRVALGAGRGALVRQVLVESVVIGLAGGVLGALLAQFGVKLLVQYGAQSLPRLESVRVDLAVLLFTFAASLLASLLFGLAPALDAGRHQPGALMRVGGRSAVRGASGVRPALVAAQFALALVLLYSAGLLLRSFSNLLTVERGFDTRGVVAMNLNLPADRYPDRASVVRFYDQLLPQLRQLPGVEQAEAVSTLFLSRLPNSGSISIEGKQLSEVESNLPVPYDGVTPGLLQTLRMTLIRGRHFSDSDGSESPRVAIVNQAFVKRFLSDGDPLGRRFTFGPVQGDSTRWIQIVGLINDARRAGPSDPVAPYVFRPLAQGARGRMQLLIRTRSEPMSVLPHVRSVLRRIDAHQPIANVRLLDQDMADTLAPRKFVMLLLAAFAVAAVGLAGIGIYGVISYMVGQRTREFGLRMALGAQPAEVLWLVLKQAGRQVAIGIAFGTAGAVAAARFLKNQLFGVSGFDHTTEFTVVLLLIGIAGLAAWIPARRATGADPLIALRGD